MRRNPLGRFRGRVVIWSGSDASGVELLGVELAIVDSMGVAVRLLRPEAARISSYIFNRSSRASAGSAHSMNFSARSRTPHKSAYIMVPRTRNAEDAGPPIFTESEGFVSGFGSAWNDRGRV